MPLLKRTVYLAAVVVGIVIAYRMGRYNEWESARPFHNQRDTAFYSMVVTSDPAFSRVKVGRLAGADHVGVVLTGEVSTQAELEHLQQKIVPYCGAEHAKYLVSHVDVKPILP